MYYYEGGILNHACFSSINPYPEEVEDDHADGAVSHFKTETNSQL